MDNSQPIFIVGVPRSGTTLITSMLSAHPRIAISPETHFLNYWMQRYSHLDVRVPQDFKIFWQALNESERFSYFGVSPEATLARIQAHNELDYKTIFTSMLQEYALKMKKPRWGEKTPKHYKYVNRLLEWYPEARVIWMLRDPRAVVASLLKVDWADSHDYVNSERWSHSLRSFEQQWSTDPRVQLIQYEALVAEPELVMQRLCQFLGEEYSPDMLSNRSESSSPIINRRGWAKAHLEAALKPVTQTAVRKWQSTLSPKQIAMIEYITRDKMRRYGYPLVTTKRQWLMPRVELSLIKTQHNAKSKIVGLLRKILRRVKVISAVVS